MKKLAGLVAVTTVLAVLLSALPSFAIQHRYIEDFMTVRHKDVLNTTALWDTVAGELRLFPFVPTLVGTCDRPGNSCGVTVSGNHVFVADGPSGLQKVDISDPTNPTFVGTCDTPGQAVGVTVSGDHAFVADDYMGLQVINISDLTIVGTYDTPGIANGITVSGEHAFVADWHSGLQVIDISDPTNPTYAGTCDTPGIAWGVTVSGDHAFVADGIFGLQVIDISDLTIVGTYDTPGFAYGVAVWGDHAFVADGSSGLQVIDISDPTNPTYAGTCDTPYLAWGVAVSGDHAFVADGSSGLQMIDMRDPTHPTIAGTCDTPGFARDVTVSGDHAFVADDIPGLQVIDISDPTILTLVGAYDTPGIALGVAVSGDHAFVADHASGLQVIDITDPTHPALVGTCDTPYLAWGVTVSGDHVFVADWDSGLQVIDISDPTHPTLVGSCDTPGFANGVAVSGDHAFVADELSGLQVVDISDPTHPTLVGTCDTPGSALGVIVSGDNAFVADGVSGLQVIDISDPTHPTLVGTYDTPGIAKGVTVSGDHVFVADYDYGLQVIDITDPTNPTLVGSYNTPGYAWGIAVSGDHAFVADDAFGLHVIDISDPTNPTLVGTYDTQGLAYGVAVSGEHAFVPDEISGLQVIQVFQSDVDSDRNVGRSLVVDASNETILETRIVATQTDSVMWELSADGGVSWQGIAPNGSWNLMTVPGTDLLWRSTHTWAAPGVNPGVTQLEIDWLYSAAVIDSVVDVPADEGGWVRLHIARSAYDTDPSSKPIVGYNVYRKVEDMVLAMRITSEGKEIDESLLLASSQRQNKRDLPFAVGGARIISFNSRNFAAGAGLPDGTWEIVTSFYALQQDQYECLGPTKADATSAGVPYATYLLTAHTTTPSVWFVSAPDSGYSVDNLPPAIPSGVAFHYPDAMTWNDNTDADLAGYRVYADSFETDHPDSITTVVESEYDGIAALIERGYHFFCVTAVDRHGNESDRSSPIIPTGVDAQTPLVNHLEQNIPNPFNPTTRIAFSIGKQGHVSLRIYDTAGRLIDVLVDADVHAGNHTVEWHGRDRMNRVMASGVYFYRLETKDFVETEKMILLR